MKKIATFLAGCLLAAIPVHSNAAGLSLKELCAGEYAAKRIYGVNPLNDGESYSRLSDDHKQIITYSFKDGRQKDVLFDVATARDVKLEKIDGYIMSPDEKKMLIQTETKPIYRHSFTAVYYLYDIANRTLSPLSDNGPQQSPKFSPDGNLVGFVRDNNLFLVKLLFNNSESQITKDGNFNEVINGIPDWVNEEEFGTSRSFDFNADNTMIAWIRYDESKVNTFSFPWYKGSHPAKEQYAEYPGRYEYKYPMAGTTNSTVSVQTFDIKARVIRTMKLPLEADSYIPRIRFTNDPAKLAVFTLNRHQDCLEVYMANPRSTECKKILRDNVDKYVSENVFKNLAFYPNRFVLTSERDGYNHLYLYDLNGSLIKKAVDGRQLLFFRQPGRRPDAHGRLQERQQGQDRKTLRRRRRQQCHIQQKHEVLHERLFQHPYSVRDHPLQPQRQDAESARRQPNIGGQTRRTGFRNARVFPIHYGRRHKAERLHGQTCRFRREQEIPRRHVPIQRSRLAASPRLLGNRQHGRHFV